MAAKIFSFGYQEGQIVVVFVQRQSDGLYLQPDGTFGSATIGPLPLVEIFNGFYQVSTNVVPWGDGLFNVLIAKPDGDSYSGLEGYVQRISGEVQIGFIEAASTTSRNAVASLKTLDQVTQDALVTLSKTVVGLSDRIDSLNQVLSRRDYNKGVTD